MYSYAADSELLIIIIIILFVLNQTTQHMTVNANEQDQKAQRALKVALNA